MLSKYDKDAFRQAVYDIIHQIPYGRATSYGAIAKAAGYPNWSRMVGRTIKESGSYTLPFHRVVNSQGMLSGKNCFEHGKMQQLLESEGVVVVNNKIKNWRNIFWNPINEIIFKV